MSKIDTDKTLKTILGHTGTSSEVTNDYSQKKQKKKEKQKKKVISLSVYPDVYADFQKISYIDRISSSELISNLMKQYILKNQEKIEEYNKLKG